jgi:hypothetical protein
MSRLAILIGAIALAVILVFVGKGSVKTSSRNRLARILLRVGLAAFIRCGILAVVGLFDPPQGTGYSATTLVLLCAAGSLAGLLVTLVAIVLDR